MRVKTYDVSTKIIFFHSQTRVTIPLRYLYEGDVHGQEGDTQAAVGDGPARLQLKLKKTVIPTFCHMNCTGNYILHRMLLQTAPIGYFNSIFSPYVTCGYRRNMHV